MVCCVVFFFFTCFFFSSTIFSQFLLISIWIMVPRHSKSDWHFLRIEALPDSGFRFSTHIRQKCPPRLRADGKRVALKQQ